MEYKFNKELYSKPSLFKTCYKYLDDFYIHLDQDDTYYYVFIESKSEKSNPPEFPPAAPPWKAA